MKPRIRARIIEAQARSANRKRLHGTRKHRWTTRELTQLQHLTDAEAAQRFGVSPIAVYHARRKYVHPPAPPETIVPDFMTPICALSSSFSLSLRR
jgi:hypothetical protein